MLLTNLEVSSVPKSGLYKLDTVCLLNVLCICHNSRKGKAAENSLSLAASRGSNSKASVQIDLPEVSTYRNIWKKGGLGIALTVYGSGLPSDDKVLI